MTATNDKIKSDEPVKEIQTVSNNVPQNDNPHAPQNQNPEQQQIPDLNDIVMDLNTLSNMCGQKVMDYADISSTFKQIGQLTKNLALGLSVYLQDKGELDTKRFKLVK